MRSCPSDPFGELWGSGRAESERYGRGYLYALRKVAEMFSPTRPANSADTTITSVSYQSQLFGDFLFYAAPPSRTCGGHFQSTPSLLLFSLSSSSPASMSTPQNVSLHLTISPPLRYILHPTIFRVRVTHCNYTITFLSSERGRSPRWHDHIVRHHISSLALSSSPDAKQQSFEFG